MRAEIDPEKRKVDVSVEVRDFRAQLILAVAALLVCAGLAWSLAAGVSWVRVTHEKNKIEEQDKGGR